MGKRKFKLLKKLRGELADIEAAGKKRGLWANIGMGLGGLLAMGLTGGAASPLVAGLMAAGGTYAGGKLGDVLAKGTKGGKIKGGRFFQEERGSLISQLGEKITSGALKSGLTAGFQQFKALGGLKEGGLGKIFKKGAGAQTEGFGSLFDFKGSAIGGKLESLKIGKELQKMGEGAIGTTESIAGGMGQTAVPSEYLGPGGSNVISPRVRTPIATEDIAGIVDTTTQEEQLRLMSKGKAPGLFRQTESGGPPILQDDSLDAILQRQAASATPEDLRKTAIGGGGELYDWEGDYEDIGSRTSAYDVQKAQRSGMEQFLSSPENRQQYGKALYEEGSVLGNDITRDIMADYADKGFEMPAHTSEKENIFDRWSGDISAQSDLALAKRGANLQRPDIPIELEREFFTDPVGDITDPGFFEFDEPWEMPPALLEKKRVSLSFDPWEETLASNLMRRR